MWVKSVLETGFRSSKFRRKDPTQPLGAPHPHRTLSIRSPRLYAMIPFFKLRSAFVTLKGLSRNARPVRSCCVMEALAVTHLRNSTFLIRFVFPGASDPSLWRGASHLEREDVVRALKDFIAESIRSADPPATAFRMNHSYFTAVMTRDLVCLN